MNPSTRKTWLIRSFALTAALSLAACGGDGGSDEPDVPPPPPPPPPPELVTLNGQVARIGALKNVVVCLDLNGNDACDSGEPASAPTGADGQYSLRYDPAQAPGAAASVLVASVKAGDPAAPTTAIDADNPAVAATDADYVLKRPAGAGGAINPLTTLVQAGVDAGMDVATARDNVAQQLAIDVVRIDGYQDDPAWDLAQLHDSARTAATFISGMLRQGIALQVGDQQGAVAASTSLRQLTYAGAGDYYVRTLDRQAKVAGSAGVQSIDVRVGKAGGVDRPDGWFYAGAYLGPNGWTHCTSSVPIQSTLGNPSRSVYCTGETTLASNRATDVAGEAMADLVTRWQGLTSNTINVGTPTAALTGALGSAVFPVGAQQELRTSLVLGQALLIDNLTTRGQPQSRNTLELLIGHYPSSGAAEPTAANTLSLGVTTGALKNLRVSFGSSAASGVATYYECDLNADQTVVSNCVALAATGSYSIDDIHGARVLRFTGQPPTPAINYHVAYTEIQWTAGDPDSRWVYRVHETKPSVNARLSASLRLNGEAWTAMQTQLGF